MGSDRERCRRLWRAVTPAIDKNSASAESGGLKEERANAIDLIDSTRGQNYHRRCLNRHFADVNVINEKKIERKKVKIIMIRVLFYFVINMFRYVLSINRFYLDYRKSD